MNETKIFNCLKWAPIQFLKTTNRILCWRWWCLHSAQIIFYHPRAWQLLSLSQLAIKHLEPRRDSLRYNLNTRRKYRINTILSTRAWTDHALVSTIVGLRRNRVRSFRTRFLWEQTLRLTTQRVAFLVRRRTGSTRVEDPCSLVTPINIWHPPQPNTGPTNSSSTRNAQSYSHTVQIYPVIYVSQMLTPMR